MGSGNAQRAITAFRGDHRFLSNFWVCDISYNGVTYPSAEHAYQASKTADVLARQIITLARSPLLAQKYGRGAPLIDGWERAKVRLMHDILVAKYKQNPICRNALMATKPVELIEGNNWGDRFWGQCPVGTGQNWLGQLLMAIRDKGDGRSLVTSYENEFDTLAVIEESATSKSPTLKRKR